MGRRARAFESAPEGGASPPTGAERLRSPAELVESVAALVALGGTRHTAERLGLSISHVRNLARMRRALAPEAWAAFVAEGATAPLYWWLALAALPAPDQLLRLRHRRARPRRRSSRLLEQRRRELPPNDVRARVLGWVLGFEAFPHAPTSRRLRETAPKPSPIERGGFLNGRRRLHACTG